VSGGYARPDLHALLELDGLLAQVDTLVSEGDRSRFDADDRYRWILHRLWIAVGNEALTYARLVDRNPETEQPWARLYVLRNKLAHQRLSDVDDDEVWRMSTLQATELRERLRDLLT
jgi:uncharacterized protein with HEPN domain